VKSDREGARRRCAQSWLVAWEVTLAAGTGSFDAAEADEEEVDPTELRVAG